MRACLLALLLVAIPEAAQARREISLDYPLSRVWASAVRFIRVDMRCPVTEKDRSDGYLLFEYTGQSGKAHAGSIEVFELKKGNARGVKVVIQVQGMPNYVELMLADKLKAKLKEDYGSPPSPQQPEPVAPAAPGSEDAKKEAPEPAAKDKATPEK